MQKGQVSFEYLITTGFLLAFSAAFFVFSLSSINDSITASKAETFAKTLAGYADFVASSGEGSSISFEMDSPDNLESINVSGRQVVVAVKKGSGTTNYYSYSKINFTPAALSNAQGRRKINLAYNDGNISVVES